ncbi:hypothetical protein V6R97_08365 [Chromohalobacter salexigens]|uniref:hypothetical protein n=1 Tax=Chromohalobacter israelensis TaxID=141390 RepID=UPI0032E8F8B8
MMIYVAHSSCVHADGDGVHSINTQRVIFDDPNDVIVLRHKLAKNMASEELESICAYPRSKVGTEYSVSDAIKAGVYAKSKLKKIVDSKYQYCSRLVAESFGHAGIDFSADPSSCTPADIQRHPDLKKIDGAVREATPEELEFAADKSRDTIYKQTKITNEIIKASQKILGKNVQTFEDIYLELVASPANDEKIESFIQGSGYLTIWADDVLKCPYRYFKTNYPNDTVIKNLNPDGLRLELSMAEKDLERFNIQRLNLSALNSRFPRKVFEQQINLYQTLVSLALQRQELFRWLLKENGALNG